MSVWWWLQDNPSLQGLHLAWAKQEVIAQYRRGDRSVQKQSCFQESDHQAVQNCQCPFNYKVMDSPALRLSSAPALAGTVMIVKVELMRRAQL